MNFRIVIFFVWILVSGLQCFGQSKYDKRVPAKNKASYELSKSLEKDEVSDEKLAADYEAAAKEQISQGQYQKAEDYLLRAKKIYEKQKDSEKIARVNRDLAKLQEDQNKIEEAITYYNSAGKISRNKVQQAVNLNDAQRLMNNSNASLKGSIIQENLKLLENSDSKKDRAVAFQQMAGVNLEMDNKQEAISNLKSALDVVDNPLEKIKINKDLANVYVAEKQYDKAIDVGEKMVAEARKTNNSKAEIEQMQTLSSLYLEEGKDKEKALSILKNAYQLALERSQTIDAKNSLELLVSEYKKKNNTKEALGLYADFMDRLETLLKKDSTLIDSKLFEATDEKIRQLETERELKDELIHRTNVLNYGLIISFVIALFFVALIFRAWYSIKQKNKKIALQSLRREMNPHFIFNSLNSVNQFIAQNNELEANKYLSSYSKLMRNVMENSNKDLIPLSTEIEQLKEYLDLEHLRFKDKFSYELNIDPSIDADALLVPNMLIQPQIENAIWHGLRYKEGKGLLVLSISSGDRKVIVCVDDDGIGLQKSKELKTVHQRIHKSRGLTNTYERIELLNNLYNTKIAISIQDKPGNQTGVIVTLVFPMIYKTKR